MLTVGIHMYAAACRHEQEQATPALAEAVQAGKMLHANWRRCEVEVFAVVIRTYMCVSVCVHACIVNSLEILLFFIYLFQRP